MSPELLIGIDIGTTATKIALFEPATGTVTTDAAPVRLWSPHAGWAEADASEWWSNICTLLPPLLAAAGGAAKIAAVAVTGMVPALVVVDAAGRPLRRAILQNDARAVDQIARVRAGLADIDVVTVTGSAVSQQSIAPKHLWLAEHEPSVADGGIWLMGSYDWVALALGARAHIEQNWALESGLFDLSCTVLPTAFEHAALDKRLVPPVVRSGAVVGSVSKAAAGETGLCEGTPIVAGGADHVLAAYAAGLTEPGDWLVKLGGAGDILVVSSRRVVDRRLYLDHHPVPELWLPNGCMATSGSLVRWIQHLLGGLELAELDRLADEASPGELICLPHFLGEKSPIHDPDLRGAFVGLHLGHGRGDLYRSCLEAVAFGMRQHVEIFEELSLELGDGHVTNGGSKSMVWKQILADVLGRPLATIAESAGASLGAAVVAGIGAGLIDDWDRPRSLVRRQSVVEPVERNVARYEETYRVFCEAQKALTPISHSLSSLHRRASAV